MASNGYAKFQIAKALSTIESHADPEVRARATEKINRWADVLRGMLTGKLAVGSRQPVTDTPIWATPEVVTGGFVTGSLLAGGPLRQHEKELLARLEIEGSDEESRLALNAYFLSEAGLEDLTGLLRSGDYELLVPEEGALLVMAWLITNGHVADAQKLLAEITPHFARLRFYPIPTQSPIQFSARIHLQNVGTVLENIRKLVPKKQILAQREAIDVWAPLYDRMIGLFLETVEGESPIIHTDAEGRWISPNTKKFAIAGGWPCKIFPPGWKSRSEECLDHVENARRSHRLVDRPTRRTRSFAQLHRYLVVCADRPTALRGRDVGMIRLILARHLTKYGAPDSEKFTEMRADQRRQVATPLHHDIAKVVQGRLVHLPSDQGLDSIDAVIQPVTPEEAAIYSVPTGTELPRSLSRKVSRCLCDTADVLVERRIITSGDTLARLVPQVIAGLRAGSFEDSRLRKLYASMYCAFRRRRSLLLLNLENQVRLHEVPWIAAIERFQIKNIEAMELSRQTLKEITVLTLRAFPQAIIPNKLLRELRALAKGADLDLPLVEELAADIFMDSFSPKFTQAAKRAEAYLDGSLYARYFELDGEIARGWPEKESGPLMSSIRGAIPSHSFVATCKARAGIDETTNWGVARNGMIIEQAQILTTHNLALLFQTLELDHDLRQELYAMAEQCFIWICRRQQAKSNHRHASLIMLKNTAYAWRQMIFYLSVMPHSEIAAFLNWAEDHLGQQTEAFRIRFGPAWRGLALAQKGHSFGDEAMNAEKLRRFLGWTNSAHWLLGPGP